jgi:hypothetical protein
MEDDEDGEDGEDGEEGDEDEEEKPEEESAEMIVDNNPSSNGQEESSSLQKLMKFISEEGEEVLFPPLDGTGFYLLTCKINHSCDPNVQIHYKNDSEKGLVLEMKVIKEITKEEEFFQSYINQFATKNERQKALQDYGFLCQCSKCISET